MDRNILPFIKVMLHLQLSSSTSLPIKPVKVLFLASSTVSMLQAWLAEHSQQHGASWNAEALLIHTAQHKAGVQQRRTLQTLHRDACGVKKDELLLTSLPFLFLRSEWFSNSLQASLILPWTTRAYTCRRQSPVGVCKQQQQTAGQGMATTSTSCSAHTNCSLHTCTHTQGRRYVHRSMHYHLSSNMWRREQTTQVRSTLERLPLPLLLHNTAMAKEGAGTEDQA